MKAHIGDDTRLVEECMAGDIKAWQDFTEKYSGLISIAIESRLKKYGFRLKAPDIEDIRQDVLISLWQGRKLEHIRNRSDISYWLAIVAGNTAIGYIRRKLSLEPVEPVSIFDAADGKTIAEIIPSFRENPADKFLQNALSEKIDALIGSLPPKEQIVIKLNIVHGKKYDEIADMLKMPPGTVSSCVKRAKEKLRKGLKDFFNFFAIILPFLASYIIGG